MPSIEIREVSNFILKNVNLDVQNNELLVLVGPNGAGKTTLLNVIAGLTGYTGEVLLDGKRIDKIPINKRQIGFLFQDLALFPHLKVTTNIAYGLVAQRYSENIIKQRVNALLDFFNIGYLKDRYPRSLSSGEKQRVALARAIAPFSKILLMDEPMSSLDPQTSKYLRVEIRSLLKKLNITTIYVTHNLLEAEEMADRIAFIHNGQIEQIGSPEEFIFEAKTDNVSEFIGMPTILNCDHCHALFPGFSKVTVKDMHLILPYEGNGRIKKVALFPQDIYLSSVKPPGPETNRFKGIITEIINLPSVSRVKVNVSGNILVAELSADSTREMDLKVGKEVFIIIKLKRIRYAERI
ncbi:MAG: ABC transporter ATP-binding protein [Thermodesulfobacteriota bacterium]